MSSQAKQQAVLKQTDCTNEDISAHDFTTAVKRLQLTWQYRAAVVNISIGFMSNRQKNKPCFTQITSFRRSQQIKKGVNIYGPIFDSLSVTVILKTEDSS